MNPACLLICNDIADQAQTQFDHWYQTEHLAERLALPGFTNARRYAAVQAAHARPTIGCYICDQSWARHLHFKPFAVHLFGRDSLPFEKQSLQLWHSLKPL